MKETAVISFLGIFGFGKGLTSTLTLRHHLEEKFLYCPKGSKCRQSEKVSHPLWSSFMPQFSRIDNQSKVWKKLAKMSELEYTKLIIRCSWPSFYWKCQPTMQNVCSWVAIKWDTQNGGKNPCSLLKWCRAGFLIFPIRSLSSNTRRAPSINRLVHNSGRDTGRDTGVFGATINCPAQEVTPSPAYALPRHSLHIPVLKRIAQPNGVTDDQYGLINAPRLLWCSFSVSVLRPHMDSFFIYSTWNVRKSF